MGRSLEERAAELRARNRLLRSVPGSGWHDQDTDVFGKLRAPHMRTGPGGQQPGQPPEPAIDTHVIAFNDVRDIVFIGEDAARVLRAVMDYTDKTQAFVDQHLKAGLGMPELTGTDRALLWRIRQRLKIIDGELRVWRDDWNDVLYALGEQVIGITGAPYADLGP